MSKKINKFNFPYVYSISFFIQFPIESE